MNILAFIVTWDIDYLKSEAEQDAGKPLSVPTEHNADGSIQAVNYYEASKHLDGTTLQGNASRHIIRTGHNLWRVVNVPWDTNGLEEE